MFHFTSHKIINISHPIIESIFHQTRQRKKNSIDKSFLFYFYKTLKLYIDLSKIRCSFVSYFSNLVYVYVYACVSIYSQLFIRATHISDFHASSFPRNWREIIEHQAFPRNRNVPQFEVDASTCVTQPGLERNVLFSFPFSFFLFLFFFLFTFTFPFRSTTRRIVTWRLHQSLLCLFCQELKYRKGERV